MPLYDYACYGCSYEFELVKPVSESNTTDKCPECGGMAGRIITLGHGGIQRTGDALPWVKDAAKILTDGDSPNPNIETIQDLRRYYKDHPNVIPAESHPALPSSLGDAIDKKQTLSDLKTLKEKRVRKGQEKLRELRSVTVTSGQATA